MNIVYTTNNGFVPQVGACMASVFENNKDVEDLQIYLVSVKIDEAYLQQFRELADRYSRPLHIVHLDDIRGMFDFEVDTLGWHITVLARLFFDRILPQEVDRIIYLDGDTIVLDSLKGLWETDMGDAVIAASLAPTPRDRAIKTLGLTEKDGYFNAGVLLIDLKKWREQNTGKRIIDYYKKAEGHLYANDQDAINGALRGEIRRISPKYNYYTSYIYYPYKALKKFQAPYPFMPEEEYDDAGQHPVIIHYLGEERPWREGCRHPFQKEFDHYLSLTPWANMQKESGWTTYYKFFYLFNKLVKPFPSLRVWVIGTFAPAFMRMRKKQLRKQGD